MNEYEIVEAFIEKELRPRVNVDGGDLYLEQIEGDLITLVAAGGCADCLKCGDDFVWWIEREFRQQLGKAYNVKIKKEKTYYTH